MVCCRAERDEVNVTWPACSSAVTCGTAGPGGGCDGGAAAWVAPARGVQGTCGYSSKVTVLFSSLANSSKV
eukprot:1594609-Pyramimonas_sp.AAC.1